MLFCGAKRLPREADDGLSKSMLRLETSGPGTASALELFRLVREHGTVAALSQAAGEFFLRHSGCHAVALRLRTREGFVVTYRHGLAADDAGCPLSGCSACSECCQQTDNAPQAECLCARVLYQRGQTTLPDFTALGSFWSNTFAATEAASSCAYCQQQKLGSLAVIPLDTGRERLGLLYLGDPQQSMFTAEQIEWWEGLASHLALALHQLDSNQRAEQALRENERRLTQAMQTLGLGIAEYSHRIGQWHCSPEFRRVFGLAADESPDSPEALPGLSEADRHQFLDDMRHGAAAGGDGILEREYRLQMDNGVHWVLVRLQTFFQTEHGIPQPVRTIWATLDFTAPKRIQADLLASQQQLRTALDAAQLGVFKYNPGSDIYVCDALTRVIFGWGPEECITEARWRQTVHADDVERIVAIHRDLLHNVQDCTIPYEHRIVRDGEVRWVSIRYSLLHGNDDQSAHVIGVVRDITREKNDEEERRTLEEQFRHAQRMEAVGRLAGGIAHDFNNLLMVIRSYAEILEDSLTSDSALRRNTRAILKAADRAATLTRQMLAFSRKQMLRPVPLSLSQSILELDNMLRRLIGVDIELRVLPNNDCWTVRADPNQIAQVVMNLAVNARDAMPQGGTLTLAVRNATVSGSLVATYPYLQAGDYAVLSVSDTGTGMSHEVLQHIFEPFFTTKGVGQGTGLGLSTVYGIVKQSGGYVLVESEPGQGSTFDIYLPRVNEPIDSDDPVHVDGRVRGGQETLLVVEDETALRESIREFLLSLGYTVLVADSGLQALSLAAGFSKPIHLMITDLMLPRMSGRELAQTLGARREKMKMIFMSGYTDDAATHSNSGLEREIFLQKPFSLTVLANRIRDLLD